MKILKEVIAIILLCVSGYMLGFYGAYTVNTIYDIIVTVRDNDEKIVKLDQDLTFSREQVYILMGKITVLKNNFDFLKETKGSEIVIQEKEVVFPLYDELKKSTLYLVNTANPVTMVGTGVLIKKDGTTNYILTNKHVCDGTIIGNCYIEIVKHDKVVKIPLTYVAEDEYEDLSLWKTSQFLPEKQPIKGMAESVEQDKVYSVGNYLGIKYIYTEGTFAGYWRNDSIINLPCSSGCSGSGVFDTDGNLVALVSASFRTGIFDTDSSKVICVPIESIKLFLKDIL